MRGCPHPVGDAAPALAYAAEAEVLPVRSIQTAVWAEKAPYVERPASSEPVPPGLDGWLAWTGGPTRYVTSLVAEGQRTRWHDQLLGSVPCAGGLGSVDWYVRADTCGLDGSYRYDPAAHRLARVGSFPRSPGEARVELTVAAVLDRLAFRYGEFSYRLACLDAGAAAGQACLLAETAGLPATLELGCGTRAVEQALEGTETRTRTVLAVIGIGGQGPAAPVDTCRSGVTTRARVRCAGVASLTRCLGDDPAEPVPERPDAPGVDLAAGIALRATNRGAFPGPVKLDDLLAVLAVAWAVPAVREWLPFLQLGVSVRDVDSFRAGAWLLAPDGGLRTAVGGHAVSSEPAAVYVCADYASGIERHGGGWYTAVTAAAGAVAHLLMVAAAARGLTAKIQCAFPCAPVALELGMGGSWRPVVKVGLGVPGGNGGSLDVKLPGRTAWPDAAAWRPELALLGA